MYFLTNKVGIIKEGGGGGGGQLSGGQFLKRPMYYAYADILQKERAHRSTHIPPASLAGQFYPTSQL